MSPSPDPSPLIGLRGRLPLSPTTFFLNGYPWLLPTYSGLAYRWRRFLNGPVWCERTQHPCMYGTVGKKGCETLRRTIFGIQEGWFMAKTT